MYIDSSKKYSKTLPFLIDNTSEEALILSVKSNLGSQVFVFADEQLKSAVDDLKLAPHQKVAVYIWYGWV